MYLKSLFDAYFTCNKVFFLWNSIYFSSSPHLIKIDWISYHVSHQHHHQKPNSKVHEHRYKNQEVPFLGVVFEGWENTYVAHNSRNCNLLLQMRKRLLCLPSKKPIALQRKGENPHRCGRWHVLLPRLASPSILIFRGFEGCENVRCTQFQELRFTTYLPNCTLKIVSTFFKRALLLYCSMSINGRPNKTLVVSSLSHCIVYTHMC